MYPEQGPKERAAEIKRIVAVSGPAYEDMSVTVIAHQIDATEVEFTGCPGARFFPPQSKMSLCSWLYLRAAEPGETVILKMRVDDVAGKRS